MTMTGGTGAAAVPGFIDTVAWVHQAQQPAGRLGVATVRMSCYTGEYSGTLAPSSEIAELAWFGYADRPRVPAVDQLLFDDLRDAGRLRQ